MRETDLKSIGVGFVAQLIIDNIARQNLSYCRNHIQPEALIERVFYFVEFRRDFLVFRELEFFDDGWEAFADDDG